MSHSHGNSSLGSTEATSEHAARLLGGVTHLADCSGLEITCKPKLLSCDPVSQCAKFKHPGYDPLDCSPVSCQVATEAFPRLN